MRKNFFSLFLLFFISCSTQEELEYCESGFGYLYKEGKEFVCPFTTQKMNAERKWVEVENYPTIISEDASDYYPIHYRNSSFAYNLSIKVPAKYFTELQYKISVYAVDKNFKRHGETKEFTFYKIGETAEIAEYHIWIIGETYKEDYGKRIFFAQREMPSYDWYNVLNVGKQGGFMIIGDVVE